MLLGFIPIIDYKAMRREVADTFKSLNTKINLDTKIKDLGMAQKQMVEIAKALTYNSRVLILDEPTSSLTQREVDALFEVVRNLRDAGVGIVYISHRLEEIFELCDRVTVIRDGNYISTKIVAETNTDQLVSDMVGRAVSCYYPKAQSSVGDTLFEVNGLEVPGLLHNMSFTVRRNEIVGFAGLAGSGRTEMAQAICGFIRKSAGELKLDGNLLTINHYRDAMASGIVYVSEDRAKYGLIVDMSICQNISMPQLKQISKSGFIDFEAENNLAADYIRKVGIKAPDEHFLVENLSGGNQQKVSVSKALALNPKLLILDEPTRGVDVGAKSEIHKLISDLTLEDLSIIMISSELPELLCMCDRIYVMSEGQIVACFEQQDATQEKILKIALEQVS
jgi:ribose transport system ATP-binding protein